MRGELLREEERSWSIHHAIDRSLTASGENYFLATSSAIREDRHC
jgi:hypothetical protein